MLSTSGDALLKKKVILTQADGDGWVCLACRETFWRASCWDGPSPSWQAWRHTHWIQCGGEWWWHQDKQWSTRAAWMPSTRSWPRRVTSRSSKVRVPTSFGLLQAQVCFPDTTSCNWSFSAKLTVEVVADGHLDMKKLYFCNGLQAINPTTQQLMFNLS